MSSVGGGVDTVPCSYEGYDETPRSPSSPSDQDGASYPQQGYQVPTYDPEAARAERERQEEERRLREEAARKQQEQFLRERDEAARSLKGGASLGIKDAPEDDLQIKGTGPAGQYQNVTTAWRQFHCAGTLNLNAITVAQRENPDLEEIRYLGAEAIKSLQGKRLQVACPDAPQPPASYGQQRFDRDALIKFYSELSNAVVGQASQCAEAKRKIAELKAQLEQLKAELALLKNPPTSFDVVDLSGVTNFTVPLLRTTDSPTAPSNRIQVPLPPPLQADLPFWIAAAGRPIPETGASPAAQEYFAAHADQSVRRYNLAQDAYLDFLAPLEPGLRERAAGLNDFWFSQSMQKARDRLLRDENLTIQRAEVDAYNKVSAEQQLGQKEALLIQASEKILAEESKAIGDAMKRAQQRMLGEYQAMMEKGLIKRGENLVLKEKYDPGFRRAMAEASARVIRQLDAEELSARQQSLAAYRAEAQRLNDSGLVSDPVTEEERNRAFASYVQKVAALKEEITRQARQRTKDGLDKEFKKLEAMRPQMLKRAEQAILDVDQLIRDYQKRVELKQRNLGRYHLAIEALLGKPDMSLLFLPETE